MRVRTVERERATRQGASRVTQACARCALHAVRAAHSPLHELHRLRALVLNRDLVAEEEGLQRNWGWQSMQERESAAASGGSGGARRGDSYPQTSLPASQRDAAHIAGGPRLGGDVERAAGDAHAVGDGGRGGGGGGVEIRHLGHRRRRRRRLQLLQAIPQARGVLCGRWAAGRAGEGAWVGWRLGRQERPHTAATFRTPDRKADDVLNQQPCSN